MPTDEKPTAPPRVDPARDARPPRAPGGAYPTRDATPYRSAEDIAYDAWFTQNKDAVMPILLANPGYVKQIKDIFWKYGRTGDDLALNKAVDELAQGGFMDALITGSSAGGGGRGGGGGGGGLSAAQQLDQAMAEIRNRSRSLGFTLDDAAISSLAQVVVSGNWSSAQLDDYLLQDTSVPAGPGIITATVDQIKAMAAQQLLTISDATAREYASRIESSEQTIDGVRSLLATQATQQYAWAADLIAQGVTVRDIMLPARDMIASTLELAPETVDLADSKYLSMVQTADEKGQVRAATLGEVASRARHDDRYRQTEAARRGAAGIGVTLAKMFTGG